MNRSFFANYTIGSDAYADMHRVCMPLGKNVLIFGGETALSVSERKLRRALEQFNIIDTVVYGKECCMSIINSLYEKYKASGADFIIGVGGGKAVDTAKYTARLINLPLVTVPTLASNCAASSALSVVYTDEHVFEALVHHEKPAYHCFIDTDIILDSPPEYIRAGIGDTMAKFYEVEFSSRNAPKTFSDELGISISRMCHEPLMENAAAAVSDFGRKIYSDALEKVILTIVVSTGMVSMLINPDFNGALAHALFYGLTVLDGFEEKFLHGDVVGYCTMVQLVLDSKFEEAQKVGKMLKSLKVETTLAERGISVERGALEPVIRSALNDPDMRLIPYEITADMIFDAIKTVEELQIPDV